MTDNSTFRQPQFLGVSHEPIHRLRCAVHGFIRYSEAERRIIDHPLFRRLRYIRQRFDYRRRIECLTVWQDEPGSPLEMAIHRDGVHSFESLILARYQMNTQVYYHRLRRIYDLYLEKYFQAVQDQDSSRFDTPEKVLALNDFRAMVELMDAANDSSAPGHSWACRIIKRHHHRDVFALDEKDGPTVLRKAGIVLKTIRNEFPETEFLEDFPEKLVSIHKIARPSDEGDGRIDFPLIDRGKRSSLGERSQLLERLPGGFRIGYVFADVSDRSLKGQIADRCRQIYLNA